MKLRHLAAGATLLALLPIQAMAAAFDTCPSDAFLVQGTQARVLGINLATGSFNLLAETTGAEGVLNALAFNTHDNFLYAWDKQTLSPVKIGDDFQAQPLTLSPSMASHFYVGDISLTENVYYVYRKGNADVHGLWKINLDSASPRHLEPIQVSTGNSPFLNIFDFAFSPEDNNLYSVDSTGELLRMDPTTGTTARLGNVGETGTFGAVYFDVDNNFYISRNKDGKIFVIDPDAASPSAALFAQGPNSAQNDGARCAFAPVDAGTALNIDFGDAPDSYGTSLARNGARHAISGGIHFGATVDGEAQAFLSPNSDDATDTDDEDGILFISTTGAGEQAIIELSANAAGNVSAWIDFDQNGQFETSEQILTDLAVSAGTSYQSVQIPVSAKDGSTWTRFRISSGFGIQATGGAPDGEVEDHEITIAPAAAVTTTYYPSESSYVTLAFEDLWPSVGDYDMNDFVTYFRSSLKTQGNDLVGIEISGQITALGATFRNGFGIVIPGLTEADADNPNIEFDINGSRQKSAALEAGQSSLTVIVAENLWDFVTPAEGCTFYRTESNCGESPIQFNYRIYIPLNSGVARSSVTAGVFNPFLFATNGFNRNSIFSSPPGRALEIHMKNMAPSDLADTALLGRADDRSNEQQALYYQNDNGLPWGLAIDSQWVHPREYVDLIVAYPDFIKFAQSEGATHTDWHQTANGVEQQLFLD